MAKITCVGCGMMGSNLISAFMNQGNEVTIVDINDKAARPYIEKGAHFSKSLEDAAADCKFILFSLPNYKVVRSVLEGCSKESLKDRIFVNTSSGVPSEVIAMEAYVKSFGGHYIDSTILTYQGEVGTKYGYLLYSGEEKAFRTIEKDLYALSNPPIYLGEDTAVAAEIVDLVVITAHFGFPYTPLEGISRCRQYGIDVDKYIDNTVKMLPVLARAAKKQADELDLEKLYQQPTDSVCREMTRAMDQADVSERLSEDWLNATNKSVANHYRKMLNIKKTKYEY